MSPILQTKLAAVRRRLAAVAGGTGAAAALCAAVLLLAVGMLLDWWLDLPRAWRVALLILDTVVVLALLAYLFVLPVVHSPDDEEIALRVEDAEPSFGTRLIAAVQFARPEAVPAGASRAMVRATIAQAESLAGPADFARVVKTDRLLRLTVAAAVAVVACGAAFAFGGPTSRDLLRRAFLSDVPVPRDTRIRLLGPASVVVARGDSVAVSAEATGVIPTTGTLRVVMESGRVQTLPLDPAAGRPGVFTRTLENVQESFTWTARLNDGRTDTQYAVTVVPRPAAAKVAAVQVYPAYTRRPPETMPTGDLSLLTGSRLRITATPNKTVRTSPAPDGARNVVHLLGSDRDVPLSVRGVRVKDEAGREQAAQELSAEVDPPAGTTGFSIHLVDEYNLRSKDPAVYRVTMLPDKPPRLKVTEPKTRETLVVRRQKQWVRFDAADDFGVAAIVLKFRVDEGPEQSVLLGATNAAPFYRGQYLWDLGAILAFAGTGATPETQPAGPAPATGPATTQAASAQPILEGNLIEFWLEATDTNDVSGPGRGVSDHYTLRVVTEADWKAAMWTRLGDSMQSIRRTTDDQEKLAGGTGSLLLDRPATGPATQPAAGSDTRPTTGPASP